MSDSSILTAFAVFFIAPVIWLDPRTDEERSGAHHEQPVLVRGLPPRRARVEAPGRVQQPHLPALDRQHALLRAERDRDHARCQRAGGLRPRDREVPRPQAHPLADARRDDRARCGARAADLPRAERRPSHRKRPFGDPAVRVLPVRRLSRVHLLRDIDPARTARRGARRRLRRAADVPTRRAPAREADRCARLLLQLRRRLEQLLPAVRRPRGLEPVPDHGRPLGPALLDAVVQPGRRRRRTVGQDLQARARARDAARRGAGRDRLPLLDSARSSGASSAER